MVVQAAGIAMNSPKGNGVIWYVRVSNITSCHVHINDYWSEFFCTSPMISSSLVSHIEK